MVKLHQRFCRYDCGTSKPCYFFHSFHSFLNLWSVIHYFQIETVGFNGRVEYHMFHNHEVLVQSSASAIKRKALEIMGLIELCFEYFFIFKGVYIGCAIKFNSLIIRYLHSETLEIFSFISFSLLVFSYQLHLRYSLYRICKFKSFRRYLQVFLRQRLLFIYMTNRNGLFFNILKKIVD